MKMPAVNRYNVLSARIRSCFSLKFELSDYNILYHANKASDCKVVTDFSTSFLA